MDNYIPSLLVGIGRGGAIVSSLLSGNMLTGRHIPFIALERKYNEERGMRKCHQTDIPMDAFQPLPNRFKNK